MVIDATFWVAISFIIFIGGLVYLKIPQKINDLLNKLILDIKNEIDESGNIDWEDLHQKAIQHQDKDQRRPNNEYRTRNN